MLEVFRALPLFLLLFAALSTTAGAQIFKTLVSFNGAHGEHPYAPVIQGFDGLLYGTTSGYPDRIGGTVFKVTTQGLLQNLHSFSGPDGFLPYGGLVQGTDGNFYGTTYMGGTSGGGTVFRITTSAQFTVLNNFRAADWADGANPISGLTQGVDGEFYGTTSAGGSAGMGTVFKMSPSGLVTTLHSFSGDDGATPEGALLQAPDGSLFGTTYSGGNNNPLCASFVASGCGTVFRIAVDGNFTTIHLFCEQSQCADGANPTASIILGDDGKFYGATSGGGNTFYCPGGCGTIFKISSGGAFEALYTFCSGNECTDGWMPNGNLVQATDGSFYGTTVAGGDLICTGYPTGCGTVFAITAAGRLTTLHIFDANDGGSPWAGMIQQTSGLLYGTGTGAYDTFGTIFALSVGLRPFVKTQPASGKVGAPVIILGTDLSDASSIEFNGTPAPFSVISSSEIKTAVPLAASTGKVEVLTPRGRFVSNIPFRVLP